MNTSGGAALTVALGVHIRAAAPIDCGACRSDSADHRGDFQRHGEAG
jgi:hypothetical protein